MALFLVLALISMASAQASLSNVSSVVVPMGGKNYFQVTATMNGPPASPYVVPIHLLYPVNPAENNGTAIVDLFNQTPMRLRGADTGFAEYNPPVPIGRTFVGDEFIGAYGYVYVDVQWDREMLPFINLHDGTNWVVPTEADKIRIVYDAGTLLSQPPAALPGTLGVSNRIVYGYSATAGFLQSIVEHPVLKAGLSTHFEGVILGSVGRFYQPWPSPQGVPGELGGSQSGNDLKIIVLNSETDVQFLDSDVLRDQTASYRLYEVAGASHNPTSLIPMSQWLGLPGMSATERQNPVDLGPVNRAMFHHMRRWILGLGTPPPSVWLGNPFNAGNIDLTPAYSGTEKFKDVPRDPSTGNALGGIRLPPVVVPIGFHNGVDTSPTQAYSATTLGQIISGAFEVYSTANLAARYPTHVAYVQAITTAANDALAAGWILAADRDEYIAIAQASVVGTGVAMTPAQVMACFGL